MNQHDESPVPEGDDPIDGGQIDHLRAEILRLRDLVVGGMARREVLENRIAELEEELGVLAATFQERIDTLEGYFVVRAGRRIHRLSRLGRS